MSRWLAGTPGSRDKSPPGTAHLLQFQGRFSQWVELLEKDPDTSCPPLPETGCRQLLCLLGAWEKETKTPDFPVLVVLPTTQERPLPLSRDCSGILPACCLGLAWILGPHPLKAGGKAGGLAELCGPRLAGTCLPRPSAPSPRVGRLALLPAHVCRFGGDGGQ